MAASTLENLTRIDGKSRFPHDMPKASQLAGVQTFRDAICLVKISVWVKSMPAWTETASGEGRRHAESPARNAVANRPACHADEHAPTTRSKQGRGRPKCSRRTAACRVAFPRPRAMRNRASPSPKNARCRTCRGTMRTISVPSKVGRQDSAGSSSFETISSRKRRVPDIVQSSSAASKQPRRSIRSALCLANWCRCAFAISQISDESRAGTRNTSRISSSLSTPTGRSFPDHRVGIELAGGCFEPPARE